MVLSKNKCLCGFSIATAAIFSAFVGFSTIVTENTSAVGTANTKLKVGITPTIAISTEGADQFGNLPINIDFVDGNMGTGDITVKVSTNDPEGYSLYVNTDTPDATLSQNGITDRVKALPGETAVADFPDNYWGYSVDGGSTYRPVQSSSENPGVNPDKAGTATSAKVHHSSATDDETEVTIGAKVRASLPSGTYSNTVVFTAMPNMDVSRLAESQVNP